MKEGKHTKTKLKKKKYGSEKLDYKKLIRIYRIFGYLYKKHWKLIFAAYTGLALTVLVALLIPWPLKLILDYVILQNPLPPEAMFITTYVGTGTLNLLAALVLGFVALQIIDIFVSYLYKVGLLTVGEKMATEIRERIFVQLQRLSLSFHGSSQSGDMIYRLTSDIPLIKTVLVDFPNSVIYRIVVIVAHVGLMLFLEWRLALVAFAVAPILYLYHRKLGAGVRYASKKMRKKESDVSSLVSENVTAMSLIQAYGREDLQLDRFYSENRESRDYDIDATRLSKLYKRANDILIAVGTGSVVFYGGYLTLQGDILPGTLVLFVSYLRNIYKPIKKFANEFFNVIKAQVSGERLLELLESNMVMEDEPDAVPAPPFHGQVEFRNVSFAYQRGKNVLKQLDFSVSSGETVALVGHSGAGKSTLISLLLRFYDPQSGEIYIDGNNIRKLQIKTLRDQITVLLQDARLFRKTIAGNIAFGKEGASQEEILGAAQKAQAHEFIEKLPRGYRTMIYEGGSNLSGGQRQRINIARAIIRQTPILILDEPVTALDAESEELVQKALDELMKEKTTFIIAHKFSTISNVERILVLDDGKLVGFGKHAELIENCTAYREMYELQFFRTLTSDSDKGNGNGEGKVAAEEKKKS